MLRMKEVTALKDSAANLSTRKSTINRVRGFENWCDENGLRKTLRRLILSSWIKFSSGFFSYVCKQDGTDHDCERNLSPMILKGNQMVYS